MVRLALSLVVLLFSLSAAGRTNTRAEATRALASFTAGDLNLNQFVNRLNFLGEQAWATAELAAQWKRGVHNRQSQVLLEAISQLAVPGDEDVEKVLVATLREDEVATRVLALRGLGRMRAGRALAPASALLGERNAAVRREAARALGELGAPKTGPLLAAALKSEDDLEAKVAMILAVGRSTDRRQASALEPYLTQSSETARLAAAQALCQLGAAKGLEFVRGLVASAEVAERLQGLLLLEGAKGKAVVAVLKSALGDADPRVRATAARLLYQGGDRSMLAWLVLESHRAGADSRLAYEDQLERLHVSDDDRKAILGKAGVQ